MPSKRYVKFAKEFSNSLDALPHDCKLGVLKQIFKYSQKFNPHGNKDDQLKAAQEFVADHPELAGLLMDSVAMILLTDLENRRRQQPKL